MNAAKYMCTYSLQNSGLANRACHGWTLTARPSFSVKPVGWFIHPLTAMTNSEPATPATAIGMPDRKCHVAGILSHPYA